MKRTISYGDYFKLRGLLALAQSHYEAMRFIEDTIGQLLGQKKDANGYYPIADNIWGEDFSPESYLENAGLKLIKPRGAKRR